MKKFTQEQQLAITSREKSLLVSAAAGSGKTAVLVERIFQIIKEGVDIDKLLVVTFTNDAAAEMRERLTKVFLENIEDKRMKRQLALIGNANISTLHAFCKKVVSSNFNLISISPNFRILNNGEAILLKKEVITEIFEKAYEDDKFKELSEMINNSFKIENLENLVFDLYDFMIKQLDYENWLKNSTKSYKYFEELGREFCISLLEEAIEICHLTDGPYNLEVTLENDIEQISTLPFDMINFSRAKSTKEAHEVLKKKAAALRDSVKKILGKIPKTEKEDYINMQKYIQVLIKITASFARKFREEKYLLNAVDFNDLEHYTIEILKTGNVTFDFVEVLTDEYQDSNEIQEYILSSVAGNTARRFMVGDLKQSIYAFRGTGPELFKEKSKTSPTIYLSKNFRSSGSVIKTVNNIFGSIMEGYDEKSMLYPGINIEGEETEAYLINGRESVFIANKIKNLTNYRYKDIAILVRSSSMVNELIYELSLLGIPSFSENNVGFFENSEIKLITNILSIIDNPRQDIPLMAVLTSPLYNISYEEILKLKKDGMSFYDCVKEASIPSFLEDIKSLRAYSKTLSIEDFLIEIIVKYKIFKFAKNASARDNIRILLDLAAHYEGSIFSFINYLQEHSKRKITLAEAAGEGADMVRIMTIHKSKGLEFPVVFVANMDKEFNKEDTKKDVIFHKKHGIASRNFNLPERLKTKTFPHALVSRIISKEALEEEKRVLYVALTRAEKKLILTASKKKRSGNSYLSFLDGVIEFEEVNAIRGDIDVAINKDSLEDDNEEFLKIKKVIETPYKFINELGLVSNISISEIKRNFYKQNAKTPESESIHDSSFSDFLPVPNFIADEKNALKRGTVLHTVMEHLDLDIHTSNNLDLFLETILNKEEIENLNKDFVLGFINSNIAKRIRKSSKVKKEVPFAMEVTAKEIFTEIKEGDGVLVHGIIDLFFEEDDKIVLLDYKSDSITENIEETIKERYKIQMQMYKKALESMSGKKVKEVIIYFFKTGEEIIIE